MTADMRKYYRDRHHAEQQAAEAAAGPRQRAIHLELADRYAQLAAQHERFRLVSNDGALE